MRFDSNNRDSSTIDSIVNRVLYFLVEDNKRGGNTINTRR